MARELVVLIISCGQVHELLIGAHPGRTSHDEITLFSPLGLAVKIWQQAGWCSRGQ